MLILTNLQVKVYHTFCVLFFSYAAAQPAVSVCALSADKHASSRTAKPAKGLLQRIQIKVYPKDCIRAPVSQRTTMN